MVFCLLKDRRVIIHRVTTNGNEFAKSRAFRAYVPTCFTCLCAFKLYVPTCLHALRATCLYTLRAYVPLNFMCLCVSKLYVPTCLYTLRACVPWCLFLGAYMP